MSRSRHSAGTAAQRLRDMALDETDVDLPPLRPLFVCTNGTGVGHLTRVSAIARHAPASVKPVVLTMCAASQIPMWANIAVEYYPTRAYSGMEQRDWNRRLAGTILNVVEAHDVDAMIFDGPWPYAGLIRAADARSDLPLIWCRRGMSKSPSPALLEKAKRFDAILVPGELAGAADPDEIDRLSHVLPLDPVLLTDAHDLVDVHTARQELGLDPERPAVLVQLGAGNINDTRALQEEVVRAIAMHTTAQICLARSAISNQTTDQQHVATVSRYPLGTHLRAFDFAVSACGYNSFHELVAAAVPAVLIPNLSTSTDDQGRRAETAARLGLALHAHPERPEDISQAVRDITDPEIAAGLRRRCAEAFPGNGAATAMAAIERLASGGRL